MDCLILSVSVAAVLGCSAYFFGAQILTIYTKEPDVIACGLEILSITTVPYFLCGIMDTMVGSLRGLGYSIGPMIVSLIGACGLRVAWIFTIFQMYRTPENLYISYPISWIVTGAVHILFFLYARKKAFALVRADSRKEAEGEHPVTEEQ